MTENKNVILSARDIVVEFDVRDRVLTAIRGVSLDLVEGEVLALVGESGSGVLHVLLPEAHCLIPVQPPAVYRHRQTVYRYPHR